VSWSTRGYGTEIRPLLEQTGAMISERVGTYGLVGVLESGDGPTLLLRTDMDGLPVPEQIGMSYASRARGQELTGA
jgi:metal-dependent amidase/aminoacylase/carboxypeptidase family protein